MKKPYAAGGVEGTPVNTGAGTVSKFHRDSAEKARFAKLEARLEAAEAKAAKAELRERTADRYSKLTSLRMTEGYVLDLDKEIDRAEKMTDAQFDEHVECIRENYQKAPIGERMLFTPPIPHDGSKGAKAEKELYEKAKKIHSEKSRTGVHCTWHDCMREAQASAATTVKTK